MIEREIGSVPLAALAAYLQGALGDATRSKRHMTHRFSQKERRWLEYLQMMLARLGHRGWIYREGARRNVHVLETSARFLDLDYGASGLLGRPEALAYVRGYFDAEGGIPQDAEARMYIQFTQKDRDDLATVRQLLLAAGISCGDLHNPSRRIDPDYWRFYVRAQHHGDFMRKVGSWHPRKRSLISERSS